MMAAIGLPALGGVIAVLALLALVSPWLPQRSIAPATAGLCIVALLLALAVLLSGERSQVIQGALAIDELGAFFALAPALAGLSAACLGLGGALSPVLPATVAAGLLVVLAGDATTAVLAVAAFAAIGTALPTRSAAVSGVFLLAVAFAVLAGAGTSFTAIRALPPDGWRAALVLAATVAGVVCGWAAFRRGFAATPAVGLYLLTRVLLDLCGRATPEWWSVPLLLAGGGLATIGAVRATRASVFGGVMEGLALQHGGWMMTGLGAAMVARAADLLPLATLAAGGALLHALGYSLSASLAGLSLGTAEVSAGSRSLDRLGGLARGMPVAASGMLVAGLSLALLPPSVGFASGWMVLQALFAAPRIGGLPLRLLLTAAVLALALSTGLGALAVVRLAGTSFLGRPRSPRAAVAEDAGLPQRVAIMSLTVACVLAGLFPGVLLQLAGPAQRLVSGGGLDGMGSWAGLQTQPDAAGYAPLWLAVMGALAAAAIGLLVRTGLLHGPRTVPAWEQGFAAPPAWMPFGDPATQADARGFAVVPARLRLPWALPRVRVRLEGSWPPIQPGHAAAVLLAALVMLLVAVAVSTPG
jgi:hydrogenase-4 component B